MDYAVPLSERNSLQCELIIGAYCKVKVAVPKAVTLPEISNANP
jgi:hypothetical protein